MDITALSLLGFSLIRLILIFFVIIFGWYAIRELLAKIKLDNSLEESEGIESILWKMKYSIVSIVIALMVVSFYAQIESAFRPKTTIHYEKSSSVKTRMQEIDTSETPLLKEAQGDINDSSNSGYSERNNSENDSAIEKFKSMK